jgi:hypothetical protein
MPKKSLKAQTKTQSTSIWQIVREFLPTLPKNSALKRLTLGFLALLMIVVAGMYGVGEWYIHSQTNQPMQYGVSFIPDYASFLGVDPQQTMDALVNIGVKDFRLTSYWSDGEPTKGHYDFTQLDWEFAKADAAHAKIDLTVGLRQPRWPECHAPSWVNTAAPTADWQPQLEAYMSAVINRYKDNPALQSYQLENEYFLKGFGDCNNFSRSRLISEYNLVKKDDPLHPVVIGRSNNALGTPIGKPTPDEFSISVYQRVWDAGITHRYLEYPQPSWFYAFLAGVQKITTGKNMMIGELQAEAWPPHGQTIPNTSLAEQNKSINAKALQGRFSFAQKTGMKQAYLWGAEYWYYRQQVLQDPSLMNVAKQEFSANPNT